MTIRNHIQLANALLLKRASAISFLLLATSCVTWHYGQPEADGIMNSDGTRFLAHATINHKSATLAIDTGSGAEFVAFAPAAERLGLRFRDAPMNLGRDDGRVFVRFTRPYSVAAFNVKGWLPIAVAAIPCPADIDGCLGWPFLSDNILQIDASRGLFKSIGKVPDEARNWTSLRLRRTSDCLCLEIPGTHGNDLIVIDTGNNLGIALSPERWRDWTNAHPARPRTLAQYYTPGSGFVITEESWSEQLSLGPLTLNNVPVRENDSSALALLPHGSVTSLGMAALRRLELIIDGKNGVAYVRSSSGPASPYIYNRAGLAFGLISHPGNTTNYVMAHVLEGTPAYEAGIRTGDILIKLGQSTSTNVSEVPMDFATTCPAGTQVRLTFMRPGATFSTTVALRDIFPSDKFQQTNSIHPP